MSFSSRNARPDARGHSVRRTFPLRLEMLEDRCVPAVFMVHTKDGDVAIKDGVLTT